MTYLCSCNVVASLSGLAVQFPRFMVLGNFSLPSLSLGLEVVQEFMAAMAATDLAKLIHGPTHTGSHTLDLEFAYGQLCSYLDLGGINISSCMDRPLSWP